MSSGALGFLIIGVPLLMFIWYTMKTEGKRPDPYKDIKDRPVIPCVVIDINMPMVSMSVFLFKLAIAAIPAVILLTMVIMFVGGALIVNLGMPIRPF